MFIHIVIRTLSQILFLIIALVVSIDFHEIGHVIFGKLVGLNINVIEFTFIGFYYKNNRWNIKRKKIHDIFSGKVFFHLKTSKDLESIHTIKLVLFSIGGIIFSIFLCYALIFYLEFKMIYWFQVTSIVILGLSIMGDGITAILTITSKSYRTSLLLLIFLNEFREIDDLFLTFIEKEMIYLNEKELKIYDCLAISLFSQLSIQYKLYTLDKKTVEYYIKKQTNSYNYVGNVGMGFKESQKQSVYDYFTLLENKIRK